MLIGYARVSTVDQQTTLQLDALRKAGVETIYQEKASALSARPELQRLLGRLGTGDVLIVYKLDRIARSLKDLLSILDHVKAVGASIRSITEPFDTGAPIGIFMIQVLGSVAQLERSIIRERSVAGQVAAIRRGRIFGRPKKLTASQEKEALRMLRDGTSKSAAARYFGVSTMVIRRIVDESMGKKNTGRYPVLRSYLDD